MDYSFSSNAPVIDPLNPGYNTNFSFKMDPSLLDFLKGMQQTYVNSALQLAQAPTAKLNLQQQLANADRAEAARQYDISQKMQQAKLDQAIRQQELDNYWRRFAGMGAGPYGGNGPSIQSKLLDMLKQREYQRSLSRAPAINPQNAPDWSFISGYTNTPR